jgi:hypothetical protein
VFDKEMHVLPKHVFWGNNSEAEWSIIECQRKSSMCDYNID